MKRSVTLALVGAAAVFTSVVASATDYKRLYDFDTSDRYVNIERPYVVPKLIPTLGGAVHSCSTEGYQCASGTSCEFVMSRSYRDASGEPVNLSASQSFHFYSCKGSARLPTCATGFVAQKLSDGTGYRCVYYR